MDMYAHYSISRSGSNCLFQAIINSMSNIQETKIEESIRFNRYRKNLIYKDSYFTKIRFESEVEFLEMGLPKKVILSIRKDKIRQAISFFLVLQGGLNNTVKALIPEKDFRSIQNEIRFDENVYFTYMQDKIERINKKEKKLFKFFEKNNIQVKTVWYEDLFTNYEDTVKDCIKFLFNVEYQKPIGIYTFKASSSINDKLYDIYMKKLKLHQIMSKIK